MPLTQPDSFYLVSVVSRLTSWIVTLLIRMLSGFCDIWRSSRERFV